MWSEQELDHHIQTKTIRLFYMGGDLAGMSAWIPFDQGRWCELGPFYTMNAFRGKGLGKQLIMTAMTVNKEQGRNLYGVSKNDIVKHIFTTQGMKHVSFLHLPPHVLYYLVRKYSISRALRHINTFDRTEMPAHFVQQIGRKQ
jgi:GNAT superfamily N-acetyltransferase